MASMQSQKAARTVLYDGGCGLCSAAARTIRRLDVLGRVELLDVTRQWPEISARHPHLSQEACLADIHVAERGGRVLTGFDGYRSLAWALPAAWVVLPLLYIPFVPTLGQRVYRHVADHRTREGCPPLPPDPTDRAAIRTRPPLPK